MIASIILHHIFKISGPQQLWAWQPSEGVPMQPGWALGLLGALCDLSGGCFGPSGGGCGNSHIARGSLSIQGGPGGCYWHSGRGYGHSHLTRGSLRCQGGAGSCYRPFGGRCGDTLLFTGTQFAPISTCVDRLHNGHIFVHMYICYYHNKHICT